ncbi:MAG TPA: GNAT family N-acetyltransferase [Candidatus Stackebrandtia faecavium]|nr:GNAT family N-acetyltransferase [Candidatus Stackebrandtia faecavium]
MDTVDISELDIHDDADVAAYLDLLRTANETDTPDNPMPCGIEKPSRLHNPRPHYTDLHFVVRGENGFRAYLGLSLPQRYNTHLCMIDLVVHPDHRRRGIGRMLMEHAIDLARSRQRSTLEADAVGTVEGGVERSAAGWRFLDSQGFTCALVSVNRRADLAMADVAAEERLHAETRAASVDYETIAWNTRLPEELYAPLAVLNSTFLEDVPLGDLNIEPEKFDADQMRLSDDLGIKAGLFLCGVVARPKGSEKIVATTVVGVATQPGDHAQQFITMVDRNHRGHKLGLRIKLENHAQLRHLRPQVRYMNTDNAGSNAHMVAINDAVGYRPLDYLYEYQRAI